VRPVRDKTRIYWKQRAEAAEAACDRHTDEIIELLEALADIRTQASESFPHSHIHDTADIALLKVKRPAQVKDGETSYERTSGPHWPE
jgi:hypothetical protein